MPLYEFKCPECGREFEELLPLAHDTNPPCPSCGAEKAEKKISAAGVLGSSSGSCGRSGFS